MGYCVVDVVNSLQYDSTEPIYKTIHEETKKIDTQIVFLADPNGDRSSLWSKKL